jgi:hypothetical protein
MGLMIRKGTKNDHKTKWERDNSPRKARKRRKKAGQPLKKQTQKPLQARL